MKRTLFLVAALVGALAAKSPAQTDLLARIHFAGADRIAADPNHAAFTDEFASAEARALESQTLDKLARVPGEWFRSKMAPGAGDGAAQLRPLLDDFLKSEWVFEMRDAPGSPEYALAIRLSPERAQFWSRELSALLQSWTGIRISPDKSGNWELKKHEAPNLFQFTRAGDWVVIDCGQDKLSLGGAMLQGAPANEGWLNVAANWPRLAQLFPALRALDFPRFQLQAVGRAGDLQLTGKVTLARPLPALQKWRLPANAIHEPLTSFTAARGMAPWLEQQAWMQPFLLQPQPDQFFIWALPRIPFQTFVAEPVPDARAAIAQLYQHLTAGGSWRQQFNTPITLALTNNELSFRDVPFMTPKVWTDREAAGDFLIGGFFPNSPKPAPFPQTLMTHLDEPNIVYYHWEFTPQRLKDLPQLSQLVLLLSRHRQLDGKSVAAKWLDHVTPTLGSSTTEVTETAPTELAFQRTSHGGLTAIELIALTDWLESPEFPSLNMKLPPPRFHPGQRPFHMLSTPAAPAPRR